MPATSRHHWGTDMDINSVEDDYFKDGKGKKVYRWLVENASKYGFCQVYSDKKSSKRSLGFPNSSYSRTVSGRLELVVVRNSST